MTKGVRGLLVGVHDVTPAHEERLESVYRLLERFGVKRYALFVVPDWHGEWPIEEHPAFAERIRGLAAQGCEIVLHGYRHDEAGFGRTPGQRLRAWGRTGREAEFLVLPPVTAARRLRDGLDVMRRLGLDPVGFVPPAWLAPSGLADRLRELGLRCTETGRHVHDLARDRRRRIPAVRWSTRTEWRARAGAAIAAARVPMERRRDVLRLAIHPPDVDHPVVARSLVRTLRALLRDRQPVGYRDILGAP